MSAADAALGLLAPLLALTGFVAVVWVGVAAVRLLFPERDLPLDAAARRAAARRRGEAVAVRPRDVVEDALRRPVRPAMPTRAPVTEGQLPGGAPLHEDLWLRRN